MQLSTYYTYHVSLRNPYTIWTSYWMERAVELLILFRLTNYIVPLSASFWTISRLPPLKKAHDRANTVTCFVPNYSNCLSGTPVLFRPHHSVRYTVKHGSIYTWAKQSFAFRGENLQSLDVVLSDSCTPALKG